MHESFLEFNHNGCHVIPTIWIHVVRVDIPVEKL